MNKKKLLIFSLIVNVLLITCFCALSFRYRVLIYGKIDSLIGKTEVVKKNMSPKEEALSNFNNDPLGAINDSIMIGSKTTITCLFLGNSLTCHGVVKEEPAEGVRGLTSTCVEKDYVHVLLGRISKEKEVNIKFSIINISQFERTFTEHSFEIGKLGLAEVKQPDYLFVQIGENVGYEDVKDATKYEEEYIKLLKLFPNSKRIITIPFWPSKEKYYATTNVAIKSKSYLVDISHLGNGTDPKNFASSYKEYKQPGVGAHPGDYGMENIAKCYYAIFNAIY